VSAVETPVKNRIPGALKRYRIMAFTTGTVLAIGTITFILQKVANVSHLNAPNAILWTAHGFLYIAYAVASLDLGLKMRWSLPRMVLVMAAGTIPTMSFVAEHFVTRDARASGAI
jgi:integral membrane protein